MAGSVQTIEDRRGITVNSIGTEIMKREVYRFGGGVYVFLIRINLLRRKSCSGIIDIVDSR